MTHASEKKTRGRVLRNRRGVTLVELIAVIAIMGILAVTIGGLLTSASTAYAREKEASSARDIATAVSSAIALRIKKCTRLSLFDGSLDDLLINLEEDEEDKAWNSFGVSANGRLLLGERDVPEEGAPGYSETEYFTGAAVDADKNPFYGKYTIEVRFEPVRTEVPDGETVRENPSLIRIYVIVKTEKGKKAYDPRGHGVPVELLYSNDTRYSDKLLRTHGGVLATETHGNAGDRGFYSYHYSTRLWFTDPE